MTGGWNGSFSLIAAGCLPAVWIGCFALVAGPGNVAAQAIPFVPRPANAIDCPTPAPAGTTQDEHVSCFMPRQNTELWSINRHNVTQPETQYPAIRFRQGDLVSIVAGGCVQTGASGLSWKRYVVPVNVTGNADDNHFGSIAIPGVMSLLRLRDAVQSNPVPVLVDPGPDGFLRLRYADDNYGDNGYWGPDDGWFQQCNEAPEAWVVIAIQHDCATNTSPDCPRAAPLDLVTSSYDDNGFLRNPHFGWQKLVGTNTPAWQVCSFSLKLVGMTEDDLGLCTRQPTFKDENIAKCPTPWGSAGGTWGRIGGHVNWKDAPVTYEGTLYWEDHGQPDDDYSLNMVTNDAALYVAESDRAHIEFDSDETIDNFHTAWWQALKQAVDADEPQDNHNNWTQTRAMIDGRKAIVIGLPGLDCEHKCSTELHPVWAIAVQTAETLWEESWAFFVRNWGNEGYCSGGLEVLNTKAITFQLRRAGTNDFSIASAAFEGINTTGAVTTQMVPAGGAVLVTFTLNEPAQKSLVDGELHLKWSWPPREMQPRPPEPRYSVAMRPRSDLGPEEGFRKMVAALTPQERTRYMSLAKVAQGNALRAQPLRVIKRPPGPVQGTMRRRRTPTLAIPDRETELRRQVRLRALTQVQGSKKQAPR